MTDDGCDIGDSGHGPDPATGKCRCCGQNTLEQRYRINRTLVRCLRWLEAAGGTAGVGELKKMGMPTTEYDNFSQLRYHGLARLTAGKASPWTLTGRGRDFLAGEPIESVAWVFDATVLRREGPLVRVSDVMPYVDETDYWRATARPHIPEEGQ